MKPEIVWGPVRLAKEKYSILWDEAVSNEKLPFHKKWKKNFMRWLKRFHRRIMDTFLNFCKASQWLKRRCNSLRTRPLTWTTKLSMSTKNFWKKHEACVLTVTHRWINCIRACSSFCKNWASFEILGFLCAPNVGSTWPSKCVFLSMSVKNGPTNKMVRRSKSRVKQWVQKVTSHLHHPGSFSRKASRSKRSTKQFAKQVLKSPSR